MNYGCHPTAKSYLGPYLEVSPIEISGTYFWVNMDRLELQDT